MVVLLSREAVNSEILQSEIRRAYEYRKRQGKPRTLPVRLAYEELLPYSIDAFLAPLQYLAWGSEADNERVARDTLIAVVGQSIPQQPIQAGYSTPPRDRQPVVDSETLDPPLPESDPRFLEELTVPGGAVKPRDKLYIERTADTQLKNQIVKWGTTTTIRAPRQTGKTSLLMQGIHYARQQKLNVVFLDFQSFGSDQFVSLDLFLQGLAQVICDKLDLDDGAVKHVWGKALGACRKLEHFMEKHVLPAFDQPVVLAMDEADCLLQTSFYTEFFGLLRSWHNLRASSTIWEKFNLILVISTESYLLIKDINQSPFNVGLNLDLTDFNEDQVRDLNRRHHSPVTERNLPQLMTLLSGHPFLTRKALYIMVTQRLTWVDLNRAALADHGPFGDHLRHQYWTIYDKPDLRRALQEIIRTNRCSDKEALLRLQRAGLVKDSEEGYICRCHLYKLYFEDKL